MVEYLRAMDKGSIRKLQKGIHEVRSKFLYMPLPGEVGLRSTTASHLLLAEMCKRAEVLAAEFAQESTPSVATDSAQFAAVSREFAAVAIPPVSSVSTDV
jgi:hypothetical protein